MSASALISELSARYPVRDVSVQEPDIEDVIRTVYGRDVRGERPPKFWITLAVSLPGLGGLIV